MQVCTVLSGATAIPKVPVGNVWRPVIVVDRGDASVGVFAMVGVLIVELGKLRDVHGK